MLARNKGNSQSPVKGSGEPLLMNGFLSTTTPQRLMQSPTSARKILGERTNFNNNSPAHNDNETPKHADKKQKMTAPSPDAQQLVDLNDKNILLPLTLGQSTISIFHETAVENLEKLYLLALENKLNAGELQAIVSIYESLSKRFHTQEKIRSLAKIQRVAEKFMMLDFQPFRQGAFVTAYQHNETHLAFLQFKAAMANPEKTNADYQKIVEQFLFLVATNDRYHLFSSTELANHYVTLFPKAHWHQMEELQAIASKSIKAQDPAFLDLNVQYAYHHHQSFIHQMNDEPYDQILALFKCVEIKGKKLAMETGDAQQELAMKIHSDVAQIQKRIDTLEDGSDQEALIEKFNLLKDHLSEYFLEIPVEHCKLNDWRFIPASDHSVETWSTIYDNALKEIDDAPENQIEKLELLVALLNEDRLTPRSIACLRLVNLNQRLFNLYMGDPSDDQLLVKVMKNMTKLYRVIEKDGDFVKEVKDNLQAMLKTLSAVKNIHQTLSATNSTSLISVDSKTSRKSGGNQSFYISEISSAPGLK